MTNAQNQSLKSANEMENATPTRALISLILSMFFVELAIMIAYFILHPISPVAKILVDLTALILILSPIVYRFAIIGDDQIIEAA